MNPTVPDLLHQGLIITVIGMTLVFVTLGLLWGIMALLTRVFKDVPEGDLPQAGDAGGSTTWATVLVDAENIEVLTAERARVAAIVAGALIANAVPLLLDVPLGLVSEHGRTAPIWVSVNRARALQSWQPPRTAEAQQQVSAD
jgi:Na+-transporting methylmalonyl-CoA/oxaloacetate decarboxylase gamma subunit